MNFKVLNERINKKRFYEVLRAGEDEEFLPKYSLEPFESLLWGLEVKSE